MVACENIRFSSLFVAGDVSRGRARRNGCFRKLRKWRCFRFLCCHLQNVFLPFGKRQDEFHLIEEVLHLIFQLQRYVDFHNCFKIFVKLERVYTPKCYVFVAKWDISGIVRYGSWKVNFILICVDRPNQPCTRFSPITDFFLFWGQKAIENTS